MEEISLRIRDKIFKANKELLCEYSDYFRAMFSGSYVESRKQEICIDMLDPNVVSIILKYMQMGMILLSEYSLSTIGEIAEAANFLQITELVKQIEYVLDIQLSDSNWMQTMIIAQNASFTRLEQFSAAHGLYSFQSMKPEYIPTFQKLLWYLSHPHLDSHSELEVFNFGFKWISNNTNQNTPVLPILACLDLKRLKNADLIEMRQTLNQYDEVSSDCLALEFIDSLLTLTGRDLEITELNVNENKAEMCKKFSHSVMSELSSIVKGSKPRVVKHIPVVPLWILKNLKPELMPHCMYTYDSISKGFEQYLEVAEKNLWGWSVASWGLTKMIIICGEHGRGTGHFMTDVKVYDTLRKEWTQHGVQLPVRRHAGVTTVGDYLYIVGGVGEFRVVLDTVVMYDLRQRSYRKIANFPDAIQSPAVCSHKGQVYSAGQKNIYCYDTNLDKDYWKISVGTEMRMSCLRSYKNYIYCIQGYFRNLYRFRPGTDEKLQLITTFRNLPTTICNLGNRLLVFTRTECGLVTVEEYKAEVDEKPKVLSLQIYNMWVNEVAGSCTLVMTIPPLYTEPSQYLKQYLSVPSK